MTCARPRGPVTLYDVSPPVGPRLAVFPGDARFEASWTFRMEDGASCDVGRIATTTHAGAHADAPSHFLPGGTTIDRVPLSAYVGPCRVLDVPRRAAPVTAADLRPAMREPAPRLVLKTGSFPDPERWTDGFAWLSEDAAALIAARRVLLVGMDTPSVDKADSKTLAAHKALAAGGVAILEGLDLRAVPPGDYELLALPLRLEGLDASPVRAVLRGP